jgi:hypothetical protein
MKLIKRALASNEPVIVSVDKRPLLAKVLGRTSNKVRSEEYVGQTTWSRPHVQFPNELPETDLYNKAIHPRDVVFGSELYAGLRPVKHLGENVYECVIDCIKPIVVGVV